MLKRTRTWFLCGTLMNKLLLDVMMLICVCNVQDHQIQQSYFTGCNKFTQYYAIKHHNAAFKATVEGILPWLNES
jgi:hypothetical protein